MLLKLLLWKGSLCSEVQPIVVDNLYIWWLRRQWWKPFFIAKDHGFCRILVLCNHKKLVQICNLSSKSSWQDQALISDLWHLKQQRLCIFVHFVPSIVMTNVLNVASIAANCPGHFVTWTSLLRLNFVSSCLMLFSWYQKKKIVCIFYICFNKSFPFMRGNEASYYRMIYNMHILKIGFSWRMSLEHLLMDQLKKILITKKLVNHF